MTCPKCSGETYDNRPKKASGEYSAKSPDFKCKNKECGGVIWPDKDAAKPSTRSADVSSGRPPKWTWTQLSTIYERSLFIAKKHLDNKFSSADVVAATATVFIAATRDGVQEKTGAAVAVPLTQKPPALETDPDEDIGF